MNENDINRSTARLKRQMFSLTCGALFLALGLVLPQVFHLAVGPQAGQMFLPMYLSVLAAGSFLGWPYGLLVGAATPLLSFMLTQMPQVPLLFPLTAELALCGLFAGLFAKWLRVHEQPRLPRLVLAALLPLLCCRTVYFCLLLLLSVGFGLQGFVRGTAGAGSVFAMAAAGWPGILLHSALAPALVRSLQKIKAGMRV